MVVVQPVLEMSNEAYVGVLSGELNRYGGVVYRKTGQIFEHLKDTTDSVSNKKAEMLDIAKFLKKNKVVIAIGLGVVIIGGVAFYLVGKNKRKKKADMVEMRKNIEGYNSSLCAYLDSICNRSLDVDTIDKLLCKLEKIKENYDDNKINIEFSLDQLDALINLVYDYTIKFAEVNSVEVNDINKPTTTSVANNMIDLRRYLNVQKQIFEKAA